MRDRWLLAVAGASACVAVPGAGTAAAQQPPAATLDDAGRLTLNFSVDRFVARDGRLHARGTAVARLSGVGDESRTVRRTLTAPVRVAQAGNRRCALITLRLARLRLDLLGLRVETSEVNLRISGVRRGEGGRVLGRLLCSLNARRVRIGSAGAARPRRARSTEMPDRGVRLYRTTATLHPQAATSQAQQSCPVLDLVLGPLELNVLGLLVELYGASPSEPVRITITAFRGGGVLGDLFCGLAGAPLPTAT